MSLTFSDSGLIFSPPQSFSPKSANPFYTYTTDGLKLYVNAFSKDSYPGTGNTWYDLSGNNANITLFNSPIKSPYSFDFSGANDYATGTVTINDSNPGDTVTVEFLLFGDLAHYTVPFVFNGYSYGIYCKNGFVGFNTVADDIYGITSAPFENEYNHFVFVFKRNQVENCKMYINGNLQTLSNRISPYNNTNAVFNNGYFTIGASLLFWNNYNANVRVCYLRIYNKELAQSEVTQNYTWSTKIFYPFFTIPSAPEKVSQDLILDIDAGNLYSYPSSGIKVISPKPYDNPSILRSMIMPLGLSTNYTGGDVEGVLYNGVGFSTNFGGVWTFDGANDYIEFPYNSAINNADNFTFECWFKSNNIALEQVIFNTNNYGQSPERGYHIEIYQSKMILQVFPSQQFTFSTVTLQSNVWYFLSVTYSNGSVNYYVNNVSAGTGNYTFTPSSVTLLLGRYRQGLFNLNGQVSNIRFYSRVLTEAERKFNYDALSPRFQVQALNNLNYLPAKEMYPEIVQTGLLLNIDPGYYKSYTGTGTSIFSLVNNYTGTLVNGPTYSTKNYGQIVFDGTNDYISVPNADILNLGSSFTISTWVKINDLTSPSFVSFINTLDVSSITEGYTFGWFRDAAYNINAKSIMLQFGVNAFEWNIYSSDTNSITDNNFHHIVVTALNINTNNPTVIFYIDGIQKNTTWWNNATKRPISYNTDINNVRIGHYYTPTTPSYYNSYSPMNLGNIQIYTTILSSKDIKQNYYATYWKYNTQIKSGQQLYLDAGNNNSYSGSGTSILDISGNNRTGTLINGVAFTANYDGGLIFDGANDQILLNSVILSGSQDFTISAWIESTGGDGTIFGNYPAGTLQMFYSPSYIGLWLNNNSAYANAALHYKSGVVNLTVQRSGGSNLFVYLDGLLIKTGSSNALIGTTSNFRIGATSVGAELFVGKIYNIQVYNRALSFSEIQENYTAYASKFGKSGVDFLLDPVSVKNLNTPKPISIISAENLPSHTFNNIFYDKFDYGLNLTVGDTDFYEFASDFGIQQLGMFNFWLYPMGFNSDPGAKYSFNTGLNSFLDYPGAPIVNTASFERNGIYRAPSVPGNKVIGYNVNYTRGSSFFYSGFLKTNLYYETTGLSGIGFGLQNTDIKNGYFAVIDVRNGTGETAAFQIRRDINNIVPIATDTSITIQPDRWYRITITWSSAGLITARLYDGVGPLLTTITVTDTTYTSGYLGITSYSLSSFDNLSNLAAQFTTNAGNIASGELLSNTNRIQPGEVKLFPPSYTTSLITTGEILRLDGANYSGTTTWTDLSASANNGTLTNNPTYTSSNYGALIFDGVNDFVTLGRDILSTRYTISAWFMLHVQANGRTQDLFDSQYSGMLLSNNGGQFWYKNVSPYNLSFSYSFKFNTWYQISVVNGANTKSIYIDGDLVASVSDSSNYEPINNFVIGSNNGTTEFLNGKIAHIHAFNRALSSTEIKQNYDALRERYNNTFLFNQFYDQINNGDFFTFGDADYYLPMSEYGPGFGITQLFMPPALASSVVQAGVSGLGLSRVPGYDYKVAAYPAAYVPGSNFFWSGWVKTNPNYITTGHSGIGIAIQPSDKYSGYFAIIDVNNGSGPAASFQIRQGIYNPPSASVTNLNITVDTWYRINMYWTTAGVVTAVLYDSYGAELASISTTSYAYSSGYCGIVSFSNSSFDNLTNFQSFRITNAKVRPDLITDNLQFYYSPSNLESYQGTGNAIIDMSKSYDIIKDGLIVHLEAGNKSSYPGTGNIWYSLVGNVYGQLINNVGFVDNYKGSYFTLNGSNQYISLNNFSFTQSSSANQYTIIIAAKLNSTSSSRRQLISPDSGGFDWGIGAGDGTKFSIFNGNNIEVGRNQDTNWHIFSGQWSSAGTKLYIDNSLDVNTTTIAYDSNILETNIGRNPGYGEYWHGNVSTVLIYNRILTEQELTQIYNSLRITTFPGLLNNVTYSTDNYGSLVFNGTNSYIDVPYTQTAVTKYSISMWVKTTTGGVIIDNRGVTGSSGRSIVLSIGNFRVSYFPFNSDGQIFSLTAPTIVADNTWHHIVCVLDGTSGLVLTDQNYNQYIKIYIDNVLQVLSVGQILGSPALPFTGLENLQIGRSVSLNSYYSGQIGTVQIFTKALTATEVRGIYTGLENPGVGSHFVQPGGVFISNITEKSIVKTNLALYLDAGKTSSYIGTGNAWNDISGNNNNLSFGSYTINYDSVDGGGTFVFNGSYEGVIQSHPSLNPQYLTLEMWLKFPTVPFSGIPYNKEGLYRLLVSEAFTSTVSTRLGATGWQAYNGTTIVKANTWHHCVATYSGQYVRIYLDGELDAEFIVNGGPSPDNNTSNLHIGAYLPGSYRFTGRISQVRLYSVALLPAQVKQNYEADVQRYGRSYILPKHTLKNLNTAFPTGIISSELLATTHEFTNLFYEEFETASSLDFGDVVDYTKSETTSEIYGIANYNLPPGINAGATGFGLYWFTMGPLLKPYVKYTGLFGFGMKRIEGGSSNKVLVYKAVYKRSPSFFWSGFVKTYFDYTTTGLSGIGVGIQPNNIYNGYYAVIDVRNGLTPDTASFQLRNGINNTVPLSYISGLALQADKWYRITTSWNTSGVITAKLYQQTGELIATLTATDNTYTSGYMGLTSYSNSLFDNFTNIIDNRITNITTIQTAETLGIHKLDPGPVRLYPSNISTLEAMGLHFLKPEGNKFLPVSILSSEILTSQFIQPGRINISPSTFIDANAHGTPRLSPGEVRLFPETFRSLTRFGLHTIKPGIATIFHASLNNQNILGTHILKPGVVNISHQSLNNVNIFGNQKLQPGVVRIYPDTFIVPHLLGSHTVVPGPIFINPNTVESLEALSNANRLYNENKTRPTAIPSAESIGNVNFYLNINTSPQTILSAEALGSHRLRNVNYVNVPTLGNVTIVGTPKFIFVQRFGLLRVFVLTLGSIDTLTGDLGEIGLDVTLLRNIDTEITTIDYIRTVVDNKYIMTIKLDTSGKTPPNI